MIYFQMNQKSDVVLNQDICSGKINCHLDKRISKVNLKLFSLLKSLDSYTQKLLNKNPKPLLHHKAKQTTKKKGGIF